jgi:hypothetical protein
MAAATNVLARHTRLRETAQPPRNIFSIDLNNRYEKVAMAIYPAFLLMCLTNEAYFNNNL